MVDIDIFARMLSCVREKKTRRSECIRDLPFKTNNETRGDDGFLIHAHNHPEDSARSKTNLEYGNMYVSRAAV